MKKIAKIAVGITLAASLAATAGVLAGCASNSEPEKTGEAYSLVHNGSSVGYASITVKGDKVTALTLEDACFPTQAKYNNGEKDVPYGKISYGSVTFTYDGTNYVLSGETTTFGDYMKTVANAEAYYKAVVNNQLTVYKTADGTAEANFNAKDVLLKGQPGCTYWANPNANQLLNYKSNRDITVEWVKTNGVAALDDLVWKKFADTKEGAGADAKRNYWSYNNVSTGATWTDLMGSNADGLTSAANQAKGAITYGALIKLAYNAAK